jgi:hypothetical protein
LFQFTLNIEEASINPGKDAEGNPRNSKDKKSEATIPWNQGGRKCENHKKGGRKNSILKGQNLPSCDVCGRKGHTQTACQTKQKAVASAKKDTNVRSFWNINPEAASASKQEESSSEKEDEESFMASWKSSQKDMKAQKNKRKCSDNDNSYTKKYYSTSFKL